jgi:hypothetical protein
MPAVEIADSIVQSGRETLEKVSEIVFSLLDSCKMTQAIEVIDGSKKWGSRVSKCFLYDKINKILSQFSLRSSMVIPTVSLCQRTFLF